MPKTIETTSTNVDARADVLNETRTNLTNLRNSVSQNEGVEQPRTETISEEEFVALKKKQRKEQLTDEQYEAMFKYIENNDNLYNEEIRIPNKISKNLQQKLKEMEKKMGTEENDIYYYRPIKLIVTPKVINDKDFDKLPQFIDLNCNCKYQELNNKAIEDLKNLEKKAGYSTTFNIALDNITSEQLDTLLQSGINIGYIGVKAHVSADIAEKIVEINRTDLWFNSPELYKRTGDFIKTTMESYLATKRNNNSSLDRSKDRNINISTNENEFDFEISRRIRINTWGGKVTFVPGSSESFFYIWGEDKFWDGRNYDIPVVFPNGLEIKLLENSRNDPKNIQIIQVAAEIANLTNRMQKECVLKTETKGCVLKYEDGVIKQTVKWNSVIDSVAAMAYNYRWWVTKISKASLDKVQQLCENAWCQFDIQQFVNMLNKMKYDAWMITEEELRNEFWEEQTKKIIWWDLDN